MKPGDLIEVDWFDSSGGRISKAKLLKHIDLPVKSWGVYLGDYGEDEEHLVLMTEIYLRKIGTLGFEVNSIVKKSIKDVKIVAEQVFDVSKIELLVNAKIREEMASGKFKFMVGTQGYDHVYDKDGKLVGFINTWVLKRKPRRRK